MGTSKGYIAPKKTEWSKARRAVSTYLRNRDEESKADAVRKYAEAMKISGSSVSSSFSVSAGNILNFVKAINSSGIDNTLHSLGRDDLIGQDPEVVLNELLNQFTNDAATLEDSLAAAALSQAFDNLKIETIEDLGSIDIDVLLREMVTEFININFDLRFEEKMGKGRTPSEKSNIMEEMHNYIADIIHAVLSTEEMKQLNFAKMEAETIVQKTLTNAINTCVDYYGGVTK